MAVYDPYQPPDDFANPYSAPESELLPREPAYTLPGAGLAIEPFSIGSVLSRGFALYRERLGLCLGVVLGAGGIGYAYQLVGNLAIAPLAAAQVEPSVVLGAQVGLVLTAYALQFWLGLGQIYALLRIARGEDAEFADLFRGGRFFWSYLWATVLFCLFLIPIALIVAIPAIGSVVALTRGNPNNEWGGLVIGVAIACGAIAVFATIALSVRLYQYPFLIVDRGVGGFESLRLSFEITRGHAMELIALSIVTGLIGLSGFLACFVGLIFTYPLSLLITACTYVSLTGQHVEQSGYGLRTDLEFLEPGP